MLVINGREVPVPGLESSNFLRTKSLGFTDTKDYSVRSTPWVRNICVHTRMGLKNQKFEHSDKNSKWDIFGVENASRDTRHASWHISIDSDGSFVCHLDLAKHKAYHAGQCNDHSIGIEMYQRSDGVITYETLESCVKILDVITREFKIQRQFAVEDTFCWRFANNKKSWKKSSKLSYDPKGECGETFVGIFGHRNATKNRGWGDPGDKIFLYLAQAGYEGFNVSRNEDREIWKSRQEKLGLLPPYDGIAGPGTVRVLEKNMPHGLWVERPGDDKYEK